MRIARITHVIFAAIMIALGVQGLMTGDFTPVWQPVPESAPAREALIYFCAFVSLGCGIGLLWRRTASAASRVLLISLVLWLLLFRVPDVFLAPTVEGSWSGAAETAVMVAGAWVLYASFAADGDRKRAKFATGNNGRRIAQVLYALALIPFGLAHFVYIKETIALVPGWLPWHPAWAYLTGCTFLAAAAALLAGIYTRWAATLSAWQLGLFTLLVWAPTIARGSSTSFQRSEAVLSAALTAGAWVVAASYRDLSALTADER